MRENAGTDSALSCPICSRLLREAVRTPCCKTLYCEECIHTTLLDQDFVCPNCESKIASLDKLKPDEEARQKVEEFVKSELQKSKEANGGENSESETDSTKNVKREENKGPEEVKKEDKVSLMSVYCSLCRLSSASHATSSLLPLRRHLRLQSRFLFQKRQELPNLERLLAMKLR